MRDWFAILCLLGGKEATVGVVVFVYQMEQSRTWCDRKLYRGALNTIINLTPNSSSTTTTSYSNVAQLITHLPHINHGIV